MCRNFDDRLYKFLIYSSALCRHEYINRIVDYVLLLCFKKINNTFESSLILQNLPPHETKWDFFVFFIHSAMHVNNIFCIHS